MKKHLLAIAGAMLATASVSAQTPQVVGNAMFSAMSPNGKWAAGSNLATYGVDIMNLETGDFVSLEPEGWDDDYTLGTGTNCISNDGIVLISTSSLGTPSYVKDGEIFTLPYSGYTSAYANAITPDGSVIAGMVGQGLTEDDVTMQTPALWYRQSDGTYSEPVALDYPKTDFTGRIPQYILVDGMSADGKTLACQIHDYVGAIDQPLVYRLTSDGWQYETFGEDLINPYGYEFPEVGPRPNALDYMTADEKEAYLAALALAATLEEPNPADYMTDEEYAAYLDAMASGWVWAPDFMTEEAAAAYEAALDYYWANKYVSAESFIQARADEYFADDEAWQMANGEVEMGYWDCMAEGKIFLMNALTLSPNAKYYATAVTSIDLDTWEETVTTIVYDLDTMSSTEMQREGVNTLTPSYVADNGSMLLTQPATRENPIGKAFYAKNIGQEVLPLEEVAQANADLYTFMQNNMYHTVATEDWVYNPETDDWDYVVDEQEMFVTGQPCCDAEMKTVVTWNLNTWDYDSFDYAYSYILPMQTAIATSINANAAPAAASAAEYFDLQGRRTTATTPGVTIVRQNGTTIKVLK